MGPIVLRDLLLEQHPLEIKPVQINNSLSFCLANDLTQSRDLHGAMQMRCQQVLSGAANNGKSTVVHFSFNLLM